MSEQNISSDQSQDRDKSEAAFRICAKIFAFWQLSDIESSLLLGLNNEDWQRVKGGKSLPLNILGRLSHILWIARLSTDLYPLDKDLSVSWLRKNNFEEPFWGMSPLHLMHKGAMTGLERTRHYLDKRFERWSAIRDVRNELLYLNDKLRIYDEPIDTLMCMAFRIAQSWQLSQEEEQSLIGVVLSLERLPIERIVMGSDVVEKLRMVVLIDLTLWHLFHDHNNVTAWIRGKNTHPLFENNSPLHLLNTGTIGVMKVVYAYLCNISP